MNQGDAPSGSLEDVAGVVGEEAALRLADLFGGIRLYIPAKIGPYHPLMSAVDAELAAKIVEHYHGMELALPRIDPRRARVISLAKSGRLTKQAIARETGYTERHVYHLIANARDEDDQGSLFP